MCMNLLSSYLWVGDDVKGFMGIKCEGEKDSMNKRKIRIDIVNVQVTMIVVTQRKLI